MILDRIFDQLELKWMALQAQKGKCICGEKVNLNTGELHHALISRQDVRNHPQANRIHHPYNVLILHSDCHKKIARREACQLLSKIYSYPKVLEWYNSFTFESNFRNLQSFMEN